MQPAEYDEYIIFSKEQQNFQFYMQVILWFVVVAVHISSRNNLKLVVPAIGGLRKLHLTTNCLEISRVQKFYKM